MHKSYAKRIMALILSVCMIAGMIDLSGFTVRAAGMKQFQDDGNWEFDYTNTVTYNGSALEPAVAVYPLTDGTRGTALTQDTDYTVSWSDNVNVGYGNITVSGAGDYEGSEVRLKFYITQKSIANGVDITAIPTQTYTGGPIVPELTLTDTARNTVLKGISSTSGASGYDYYYTCSNNIEEGTANVTINGCGNYNGTLTTTFTIEKLDPEQLVINLQMDTTQYTGSAIEMPVTSVTYKGTALTEGTDYRIEYANNIYAGTEASVKIIGINKYAGLEKTAYFTIRKSLGDATISIDPIAEQVYTGQEVTLKASDIIVRDSERDQPLTPDVDYEIKGYASNINAGTATVTIQGKGAYTSSTFTTFTIRAATMADVTITVDDSKCIYNGGGQIPSVSVTSGLITYTAGTDYTVTASNNVNAGTNTGIVTISPVPGGRLQGNAVKKNFSIAQKPLSDTDITMAVINYTNAVYSGSAVTPDVELKHTLGSGTEYAMLRNTDYTLSYTGNINAGTATVTAKGTKNYTGEKSCTFTIEPVDLNTAAVQIADIPDQTYTGNAITLGVSITVNGRRLSQNTDFELNYQNNVNAGQATILINGINNYTGTISKYFTINKRDIATAVIQSIQPQSYTGNVVQPKPTLTYGGNTLTEGTDYELSWGDETTNKNVGTNTATVTIKGIGTNFEGEVTRKFSITARNIATGDYLSAVNLKESYVHTGSPITESGLQMRYEKTDENMNWVLVENQDYTLKYRSNTEIGTATIEVTGTGNYSGTKTFTFRIKGSLNNADMTKVTIPDQIYTGLPVEAADMVVTYNGKKLTEGTDYTTEYNNNVNVGDQAAGVEIIGIGDYQDSTGIQYFNIKKKNLDTVTEDDANYVISGIAADGYIYSGYAIEPPLSVSYYGNPLTDMTDYKVDYGANTEAGEGSVTLTGLDPNFEGTHTRTFQIHKYDIGESYAKIDIQGLVTDVVLDDVETTSGVAFDTKNKDSVVQTDLSVWYTPVNAITNAEGAQQQLEEGKDYTVSYEKNDAIGTAKVIFTGQGNFTGTIEKTFAIRGDLANEDSTQIADIPDYPYTPSATDVPANTPVPEVTYRGALLEEGTDYTVSYENNANVGDTATVKVTAVDGGNYVNETSKTFTIVERELTREDPDITIEGLVEDGYEYTGSEIIPELVIKCKGVALVENRDYTISTENSVDVPPLVPEDGVPVIPTVIIKAVEGGNYTGEIRLPFTINPRQITEETIRIDNVKDEYDYDNGNPITIPHDADESEEVAVTYVKDGLDVLLVEGQDYTMEYLNNVQIGEATIRITGINNYANEFDKTFRIMGNLELGLQDGYITLEYNEEVPYGIVAVYPKMIFKDYTAGNNVEPKILVQDEDFVIVEDECQNNIHVADKDSENPPTVVIQGAGCYRGKLTRTYTIVAKDLSTDEGDITASFAGSINDDTYTNAFEYTGQPIEPDITVYNHGVEMSKDVDYVVAGYVNNTNVPKEDAADDERPGVIINAVENGNYLGSKVMYFDIIPKTVSNMRIDITDGTQVFDRTEKQPAIELYYIQNGERVVVPAEGYDVAYSNNVVAAKANGQNPPTITVTGKGNYGGELTQTFTIEPESLAEENTDFIITGANAIYIGSPVTTTFEVKTQDGTVLEEGVDYEVGSYSDNTQAGTGYAVIRGLGNYTGSRQASFRILPSTEGEFVIAEIPAQTYNTKPQTPEISVSWAAKDIDASIPLTEGADYNVTYSDNINAGTATVTVVGAGNFAGTATATFTINKKNIGTLEEADPDMVLEAIADQQYTGRGVTPAAQVVFRNTAEDIDRTLVVNSDYKLTYTSNVAVGTATAIVTGINNYSGTMQTAFRILGNMSLADVKDIPVQQYTGEAVTPLPSVSFAGKNLVENTDYTLEYENNVERGTAKIIITGMGWYTGTKTITFDIAREFSSATSVRGVASAYTYTGVAIKPPVLVEDNGTILSNGTDYKVTYSNNVNAGTATITVTGINRYRGTRKVSFKITPQQLGRATVAKIADQTYNGKKKQPKVKVTSGSVTLKANRDYTTVYVGNKNPGKASVIIKGKGNFTGTQTVNFNIVVPKVTKVKVKKYTDTSITFSWKKNNVVSGYEIYNAKNKRLARVKKKNITSATVSKLKAATTGTYRVRAYVIKDGQYYYSAFVKIKASTAPKAANITSLTSAKSKQVVLKWSKVKGATQYQIYRSTSANGKYKKIASTKKTSYTDKKATGGKTYYYKIRVCRKVNKKNYYSNYSSVQAVTAVK